MRYNHSKFRLLEILLVFCLLTILLFSGLSSAETSKVKMPIMRRDNAIIKSGSTNDIFFKANPEDVFLKGKYTNLNGSSFLYTHKKENSAATFLSENRFSELSMPDPIYQYSNFSDDEISLLYQRQYYDLTEFTEGKLKGNSRGDTSILLVEDKMYGFSFEAEAGVPVFLYLSFAQAEGLTTQTISLYMISPSGLTDWGVYPFPIHVGSYIPIFPQETGKYVVFLKQSITNVMLTEIALVDNLSVDKISSGYSEHKTGTETDAKFLKRDPSSSGPHLYENGFTIFNPSYQSTSFLGTAQFRVFYMGGPLMGNAISSIIPTSEPLFISVILTPPDDSNPYVAGEKKNLGIDDGFDIDYAIFSEEYPIPTIPENKDFIPIAEGYSNGYVYYQFNPLVDTIVGYNGTSLFDIQIMNIDTMDVYTFDWRFDPASMPVPESKNDLIIIPKGEYIVQIKDEQVAHFQTFIPQKMQNVVDVTLDFGEPIFYLMENNGLANEYLNVTYFSKHNTTDTMNFAIYNMMGENLDIAEPEFSYIGNSTHLEYKVKKNDTVFKDSNNLGYFNLKGLYLRVEYTENILYNTSVANPILAPVLDTDVELKSILKINRESNIESSKKDYPNRYYTIKENITTYSHDLPGVNNTIQDFYTFAASESGYVITIRTTNRTISYFDAYRDADSSHDGMYAFRQEIIDGITNYIYTFEFACTDPQLVGMILEYNNPIGILNGTMEITIEKLELSSLPKLLLGSLEPKSELWFNPGGWSTLGISATVVGVTGAIAGIYILVRRKFLKA